MISWKFVKREALLAFVKPFLSLNVLTRLKYIKIYLRIIKYALYYTLNIKFFFFD